MGRKAAGRKTTTVAQSTVGAHFDQALDVQRDFLAEIAFHFAFFFENLADAVHFVFRKLRNLALGVDARPVAQG